MAFTNKNVCRTLNVAGDGATFVACGAQECSEVVITCEAVCEVKSSADTGTPAGFRIPADTAVTIRGITNADQISIKTTGSVTAFVRAQYYSSMTPAINP